MGCVYRLTRIVCWNPEGWRQLGLWVKEDMAQRKISGGLYVQAIYLIDTSLMTPQPDALRERAPKQTASLTLCSLVLTRTEDWYVCILKSRMYSNA